MKIKLPQISWLILKEVLKAPEWATTAGDIYIAGKMDEEDRIKIAEIPKGKERDLPDDWSAKQVELELSPKEIEVIKKCINFSVSKGRFFANKWSAKLLVVFLKED